MEPEKQPIMILNARPQDRRVCSGDTRLVSYDVASATVWVGGRLWQESEAPRDNRKNSNFEQI